MRLIASEIEHFKREFFFKIRALRERVVSKRVVSVDVFGPPQPERGHKKQNDGTQNRNEGTKTGTKVQKTGTSPEDLKPP